MADDDVEAARELERLAEREAGGDVDLPRLYPRRSGVPVREREWRTGKSWGVTVVALGEGPADEDGRRSGDELVAVAFTAGVAEHIVALQNAALNRRES